MSKKILNSRPIVLFALVMLGVIYTIIYNNFFALRLWLAVCATVLFVAAIVFIIIFKNKTFRYVVSRISIFSLAIICGIGCVCMHEMLYSRDDISYSGYAVVSGRIAEVGDLQVNNYRTIVLDNVTITSDDISSKLNYKTSLNIICDGNNDEIFVVGKRVDVYAKVSPMALYYVGDYGLTFYSYLNGISYSGYATESNISVVDDTIKLTLSERVKNYITSIVENNMDEEYSGLAVGMLFGDKSGINDDIYSSFSTSGIAHLLAVSGLHVGFLLALLLGLAKLCRIKGIFKFLLISVLLVFYAYLCGFTISVTRATIMSICMLYAGCRYKKYDSLNALAMALIIVLIINPFSCSTVGFKLSFIAVLSIILLSRPLTNLFGKILKPKMAATLAVMIAVQLGIASVQIIYFKNITLLALVANFVCIPLASIAYELLFVTLIVSLILPFMSFSVYIFEFVMQAVVKFVLIISRVSTLQLAPWQGSAVLGLSLPAMYLSSNYLFVKNLPKKLICGALCLAILIILLV